MALLFGKLLFYAIILMICYAQWFTALQNTELTAVYKMAQAGINPIFAL